MKSFSQNLIDEARAAFIEGDYDVAEPMLNQPLLLNSRNPEVLQMLATIYYDQGKFNKAINTFKRALEMEPTYTDAAIGLSIILNDIGRYDEARQVFEKAQTQLDAKKPVNAPDLNRIFSDKHAEMADLYLEHHRFEESAEQYIKAISLASEKADLTLRLSECYLQAGLKDKAIRELKALLAAEPRLSAPRLKLGLILYNSHHIAEAVDQWENVLRFDAKNQDALRYLKMAQTAGVTTLNM